MDSTPCPGPTFAISSWSPGADSKGPQMHGLEAERATWFDGELFEDTWNRRQDFRRRGEDEWKGHTVFMKKKAKKSKIEIHERFLQVRRTHSQGGHIVLAYDKALETEQSPKALSIMSWKSYKLKRCTVNTLAAEAQAVVQGVGASYWMRFLWSGVQIFRMNLVNWQEKIRHTPFLAATDSRSLSDNLSKPKNVAAHIEDKRAAIDLTIIENDMVATRGQNEMGAGWNHDFGLSY